LLAPVIRERTPSTPVVVGGVDVAGVESTYLAFLVLVRRLREGFCTDTGAVVVIGLPVPRQSVGEGGAYAAWLAAEGAAYTAEPGFWAGVLIWG